MDTLSVVADAAAALAEPLLNGLAPVAQPISNLRPAESTVDEQTDQGDEQVPLREEITPPSQSGLAGTPLPLTTDEGVTGDLSVETGVSAATPGEPETVVPGLSPTLDQLLEQRDRYTAQLNVVKTLQTGDTLNVKGSAPPVVVSHNRLLTAFWRTIGGENQVDTANFVIDLLTASVTFYQTHYDLAGNHAFEAVLSETFVALEKLMMTYTNGPLVEKVTALLTSSREVMNTTRARYGLEPLALPASPRDSTPEPVVPMDAAAVATPSGVSPLPVSFISPRSNSSSSLNCGGSAVPLLGEPIPLPTTSSAAGPSRPPSTPIPAVAPCVALRELTTSTADGQTVTNAAVYQERADRIEEMIPAHVSAAGNVLQPSHTHGGVTYTSILTPGLVVPAEREESPTPFTGIDSSTTEHGGEELLVPPQAVASVSPFVAAARLVEDVVSDEVALAVVLLDNPSAALLNITVANQQQELADVVPEETALIAQLLPAEQATLTKCLTVQGAVTTGLIAVETARVTKELRTDEPVAFVSAALPHQPASNAATPAHFALVAPVPLSNIPPYQPYSTSVAIPSPSTVGPVTTVFKRAPNPQVVPGPVNTDVVPKRSAYAPKLGATPAEQAMHYKEWRIREAEYTFRGRRV